MHDLHFAFAILFEATATEALQAREQFARLFPST